MKTNKLFAAVLATAVFFGSTILSFGRTQHSMAYQTVSAAENVSKKVNSLIGDVNGDGIIDSSDAADILTEFSSSLTGKESVLTVGQKKLADLNFDSVIDSSDASLVLMYYAHIATGGKLSIEDFLYSVNTPPAVTTTSVSTKNTSQTTQTTAATRITRTTATFSSKNTSAKTTANTKPKTTSKTTVKTTVSSVKTTALSSSISTKTSTKPSTAKPPVTTVTAETVGVTGIGITRSELSVNVGEGALSAYVTMFPVNATNKDEIWTSSKPDVAIVDSEGWVVAKKPGNTIITVQSVDNPEVFAFVLVTVIDPQSSQTTPVTTESTSPVPTTPVVTEAVREIQVIEKEVTLTVGEQKETMVKVLPENAANKALKWTSSDKNVASVDQSGKITAVGSGSCTITVNSAENSEIKSTILVNVKNTAKVTEIRLSKYEINISVGQSDISRVTMLPSTAVNKEELWITSNSSIATVDKYGWIHGVSEGECTITVSSVDNPAVKAEIHVKVVNGSVEPPDADFSYIAPGKSTENEIAFMLPFPQNAKGRYIVDYVITDKNGKVTTISTPKLVIPTVKSAITMLTAETNEFTAEAYLTDLNTSKCAKIGTYSFVLKPRDAKTETEDIFYAFSVLGGITE